MEELRNDVYNPIGKVGILNGVKVIVAPHESCVKCAIGCKDVITINALVMIEKTI